LERTDDDKLAFARYVDAIGMAWARVSQEEDKDHCNKAVTALEEAFAIRYELLGPWHVDTVETLNKLASVHLHLREYDEACNAYWEVFWVRRAIFGPGHPSVAIAAHALGNVFVKLASTDEALQYFQIAVEIYDKMHLPNKHPAVARLMRDYKRLDRICLTNRLPPQKTRKAQR
jgi:tetratricopeptide (TPR) repeat protein